MNWLLIYLIAGALNATLATWLVVWKDAMESSKEKRKKHRIDEITLGGVFATIGAFLLGMFLFPIIVLMNVGMIWEIYDLGNIVLWKRKPPTDPELDALEKKAHKFGLTLKKDLNLNGIKN